MAEEFSPVGLWYAKVSPTESEPVEFQVRIAKKGPTFSASLMNGAAAEPFSDVAWDGRMMTLRMGRGEAKIVASVKGSGLEGTFVQILPAGSREYPFSASRRAPPPVPVRKSGVSVAGRWTAEIALPGGIQKAVVRFAQNGTAVTGTVATATGGYGPLHGTFDGEQLVLMALSHGFVHRFTAEMLPDGTLAGEFRSGTSPPVDWKAARKGGD